MRQFLKTLFVEPRFILRDETIAHVHVKAVIKS